MAADERSDGMATLVEEFRTRFGRSPERAARAPGRVNLIGEHTDYNDGLVLPCAIDRVTRVVGAERPDATVRIWSRNEQEEAQFEIAEAVARAPATFRHWSDYVRGVVFALAERGRPPGGLDVAVASDVPIGAGLSSSAAFTVSLATLFDPELSARERAGVAHRAESHYLGVGSGILDQFASALGARDHALRIDCRSREVTRIPMPPGRICVLLADSGVRRSLAEADSGYRQRVAECAAALGRAKAAGLVGADAGSLRDLEGVSRQALEEALAPPLYRRARHVLSENERVRDCCDALAADDLSRVGDILRAGHASLRDDYAVSVPELDALCEVADALLGVHGSRLTGAGFGGCTLHLVEPAAAETVSEQIASAFQQRFGRRPPMWRVATADGAASTPLAEREG